MDLWQLEKSAGGGDDRWPDTFPNMAEVQGRIVTLIGGETAVATPDSVAVAVST